MQATYLATNVGVVMSKCLGAVAIGRDWSIVDVVDCIGSVHIREAR